MKIIKPERINLGETIGIISPSQSVLISKEDSEAFEKGILTLQDLGFKVKLAKNAKGKYFYSAGTPKQRIQDFNEMLEDTEIKVILMSIGGETANEVLPLIDFRKIRKYPKIIIGMSDATTLLVPITERTGLVTFYGPDLIYSFGKQKETNPFIEQFLKCITKGEAGFSPLEGLKDDYGKPINSKWRCWRKGKVEGVLIGGYLEIIVSLIGMGYFKDFENKILYLESMEGPNTIHMRLQNLKLMGVFDKIKGLILGYFPDINQDPVYYREIGDIILDLTKDKTFPILQVNELGHIVKNYTWPNGINVRVDATSRVIKALENCAK